MLGGVVSSRSIITIVVASFACYGRPLPFFQRAHVRKFANVRICLGGVAALGEAELQEPPALQAHECHPGAPPCEVPAAGITGGRGLGLRRCQATRKRPQVHPGWPRGRWPPLGARVPRGASGSARSGLQPAPGWYEASHLHGAEGALTPARRHGLGKEPWCCRLICLLVYFTHV